MLMLVAISAPCKDSIHGFFRRGLYEMQSALACKPKCVAKGQQSSRFLITGDKGVRDLTDTSEQSDIARQDGLPCIDLRHRIFAGFLRVSRVLS